MNNIKSLVAVFAGVVSLALGMPPSAAAATNAGAITVTPGVAAGSAHTVALKPDGSLWTWGSGILGDGSTIASLVPIQIGTGYGAIAAGVNHTIALKSDGSLWSWGNNYPGQLGDGTTTTGLVPKQIDTGYAAIAAGYSHTVALKSDGSLWAWGSNAYGQLGDGTTTNSLAPKRIDTGYTAIAAGYYHTLAIKSDGSLWSWGLNWKGQIGDGTTANSLVPKQIGTGYTAVAGGIHTVALKADGGLWAWGFNSKGQLGDGTTTDSLVPKQIDTGYTAIAAGLWYTAGVKRDGSLWAWGHNEYGQLGDGTKIDSHVPKQIGTGYMMVAAGENHAVAIKSDGSLWAWGYAWLGDGNISGSPTPRPIGTGYAVPDSVVPSAPAGLIATPAGATQINIFWATPPDNVAVVGYKVYRDGVLVGSPTTTNYSDADLTALTTYSYAVSACDAAGNCSAPSAAVSAKTLVARDIHLPTVPAGLTATAVSATRIDLAWTPATDSVGVTQYKIYRTYYNSCVSTGETTCLAWYSSTMLLPTLAGTPPAASYTDTGLRPSSPYDYSVQACNAAGNCSAQSVAVSATTQPVPTDRAAPAATGAVTGPITNQTITITMTPPQNMVDLWWVGVYVAAITPSSMGGGAYLLAANGGWIPFTTCASAPSAFIGTLGATLQLKVVPTPTDLSALTGTSIYVGYGIGGETFADTCSDMLDHSTMVKAYTIN